VFYRRSLNHYGVVCLVFVIILITPIYDQLYRVTSKSYTMEDRHKLDKMADVTTFLATTVRTGEMEAIDCRMRRNCPPTWAVRGGAPTQGTANPHDGGGSPQTGPSNSCLCSPSTIFCGLRLGTATTSFRHLSKYPHHRPHQRLRGYHGQFGLLMGESAKQPVSLISAVLVSLGSSFIPGVIISHHLPFNHLQKSGCSCKDIGE
jgi:hypothetical protein